MSPLFKYFLASLVLHGSTLVIFGFLLYQSPRGGVSTPQVARNLQRIGIFSSHSNPLDNMEPSPYRKVESERTVQDTGDVLATTERAETQPIGSAGRAESSHENGSENLSLADVKTELLADGGFHKPRYPKIAEKRGAEGRVFAKFSVLRGFSVDLQLRSDPPSPVFEESVREAMEKWKFRENVEGSYRVEFYFSLGQELKSDSRSGDRSGLNVY